MLWTEDWFGESFRPVCSNPPVAARYKNKLHVDMGALLAGDGLSWQWSYYAALMSSATRLAAPYGGTREVSTTPLIRRTLLQIDQHYKALY